MYSKLFGVVKSIHTKAKDFLGTVVQPKPIDILQLGYLLPYGLPTSSKNLITIGRTAYVVQYDPIAKIPSCVSWTLTPEHSIAVVKRSDSFAPDYSLDISQRASLADYETVAKEYDRGHNISCETGGYDVDTERQTFYLSNMTAQKFELNRGTWKILEVTERAWTKELNLNLVFFTGPVYTKESKTFGTNNVVMPDGYFKIIVNPSTNEALAFYFDNIKPNSDDISQYQTTVSVIEAKTGLIFNLKDDKTVKNKIWPVNIKEYDQDRK